MIASGPRPEGDIEANGEEDALHTFQIDLMISHPTLDPDEISTALRLTGHYTQRAGDPRRSPLGTVLEGRYHDTRWRHCVGTNASGQHFADEVSRFVNMLTPQADFFARLRESGGEGQVILSFLGRDYLGDTISHETLRALVKLELGLGLEVFVTPQRMRRRISGA